MIFTFDYDTAYDGPPFPTLQVTISSLNDSPEPIEATAYIDSGADGTIIPIDMLQQLNARKVDSLNLRWGSGPGYKVDIFEILLEIGSYPAIKVYAVGDHNESQILIGRDVLNYFIVTLNGLAEAVEISQ